MVIGGLVIAGVVAAVNRPSASTCEQLESAPLFLIVRNSSTQAPIAGVHVSVSQWDPAECPSALGAGIHFEEYTNSDGSVEVCCTGAQFVFQFIYLGHQYQVSATDEGAEAAECVTISVPSGITQTSFGPLLESVC